MANLIEIIMRGKGNAVQAVKKLKTETKGLGKQAGLSKKLVTGLGGAMATVATVAVIAQIAKAGIQLVKLGAQAEGVRGAFRGLGGDLERLREGAMGMISDVELMRQYNQAAQLVSTTFAKQLPEAMGHLAKVSAATGQSMQFMMDSLVRGVGRMSPLILDNLGIQVDLAAATKRSAEMFGVQADALTKTQQQAGLMAEVMDKLRINTADMPEVAGTAATSLGGLATSILNLRDAAAEWLALSFDEDSFGADIVNRLTGAIDWLTEQVKQLSAETRRANVDIEDMQREMALGAIAAREAAAAAEEFEQATKTVGVGVQNMGRQISAGLSESFKALWAEAFDPGRLQSAMGRWNDIIDSNLTKAFAIIGQHQDREREAQFRFDAERIEALLNFEAEKAALLDAGRAEDAARLEAKFVDEATSATAAFENEQGLLNRNLLVQQVARARAYVAELQAQDTKIRMSLTSMVLAARAAGVISTGREEGLLDLIKEGATRQLDVQIAHAKESANIAAALGKNQIDAAEQMMIGIIARLNLQNEQARAALNTLQNDLTQFTNNFLNNIQRTFGGDIGFDGIGDSIEDGAERVEERATRALADVARDIDTAIEKMLSSIEALQDVVIPEGLDEAFAQLGIFFQKSVAEVHKWISAPGVKAQLDEIRDFLGAVIDLFRVINVDLAKIAPMKGDFLESTDRFIVQMRAVFGRLFIWMTELGQRGLRFAVELAGIIADDTAKIFKLIGPDLSKVVPAKGDFVAKADGYIAQLRVFFGRALIWMTEIDQQGARWIVKLAGSIAEDVAKMFRLIGPDLSKVVPVRGNFAIKAEKWLNQLRKFTTKARTWLQQVEKFWDVKQLGRLGDIAENIAKFFSIIGPDLASVVPTKGNFGLRAEQWLNQIRKITGKIKAWLGAIERFWDLEALSLAGDIAEDVAKMFSLLDVKLGNIGNTAALLAALRNMQLYFFTLEQIGAKIMDWLGDRDDATVAAIDRAAGIAENVMTLFGLLDISTDLPKLGAGFDTKFTGFVDKLQGMLDHALPIFEAIHDKWGEGGVLGLAANVVENVQTIFGGFADIIQSIEAAANLGGLDVGAAWAMMQQFQDLLNPPAGVVAPSPADVANVGVGGVPGAGEVGAAIVVHDWRIILEIPQLDAIAEGHVTDEVAKGARAAGQITLTLVAASV